jgi:hypothetical protein
MNELLNEGFLSLIDVVSRIYEVVSIGKSGGKELPDASESDIDIFVFCNAIPSIETRQMAINMLGGIISGLKISDYEGRFWGTCDFVTLNGVEICLMYFTIDKINAEIESILHGERIDKEDNYFYPTGRCASMLSLYTLYDKTGYINSTKEKLSVYPSDLSEKIIKYHLCKINDTEDFERALSRKDVLFYHFVLENALDHFLQVLFAINKCYFPSRKRSLQFINTFSIKPLDCSEKLLQAIALGGSAESLSHSYSIWKSLYNELEKLSMLSR